MPYPSNARADRYPVTRVATTGPRTSTTETPFCDVNDQGWCENEFHTHTDRVRPLRRRWTLRHKVNPLVV